MSKRRNFIILGFAVCVVILTFASFFDLKISQHLYSQNNFYATFFDFFGELPLYALISISLVIISVKFKNNNSVLGILALASCVIISFVVVLVFLRRFFGDYIPLYILALFALFSVCFLLYAFGKVSEQTFKKLYNFALFSLVYCVVILLANQGVKMVWGRCRFYTMVENGNFDNFTNWWEICGFTGYKSFYSGHVTSAMSLLVLLPLARSLELNNKKYVVLHILIYSFVVLVAVSRVIYGAHFLSDVTFACIICAILYLCIYSLLSKKLFNS